MALGRAGLGRSATLVALAVHYLLITSFLPAFHVCERRGTTEPCHHVHDDALAVREHAQPAEGHGHGDCVACRFTLQAKTILACAAFRAATSPLRVPALLPRSDLPSHSHLLTCVLPRGPPAPARV